MRHTVLTLAMLLTVPALAQVTPTSDPIKAACGAMNENFKVSNEPVQALSLPAPGKARIYIEEVQDRVALCPFGCKITAKVGLDGGWVGATSGNSFVALSVDPGEHHLCVAPQSISIGLHHKQHLAGFTAEPGKTYYFRAHITPSTTESVARFELEPLNPDEGTLLATTTPKTIATKK